MAHVNDAMKGQWAPYKSLINIINNKGSILGYPKTGKHSITIYFNQTGFEHIVNLADVSGWTPVDIVGLLARRGLADLYLRLDKDGIAELGLSTKEEKDVE